jgi:N-acyl-D-amino-acid deacylase
MRWACVLLLFLATSLCAQPPVPPEGKRVMISGKAGPDLEPVDRAMFTILQRHAVPGAALAIVKDGRLVYARGFGWADVQARQVVQPTTLFGLASLSKTFTAVAILKLVDQGKLSLDDRAFDILAHIKPPPGCAIADPRIRRITIRQLLNHSGGWNRALGGDPVNWSQRVADALDVSLPISAEQMASYLLTLPLDFEPGTDNQYSNFGYTVLGLVIEKVSGKRYHEFVLEQVLAPAGIEHAALSGLTGKYLPGEARRYLVGIPQPLPVLRMPMNDAAGGWCASVVDVARFLTALDGSRGKPLLSVRSFQAMIEPPSPPLKRLPDGSWVGLGWDRVETQETRFGYFKDGNYHGVRAFMKRLPSGVQWVLLLNVSTQPDGLDSRISAAAKEEVHQLLERTSTYPRIDLFGEFSR